MPRFFSRRYMRRLEAVGSTEKVVGGFILLLTTGIVTAFIVQVATNKDYLFDVDEAAYRAMEVGREVTVAQQMLPSLDDLGWRPPTQVSRYTPDNLYQKINGRAEAYLQFHFVRLTFGTYHHQRDTDRTLDVYQYEMGEPVNAFGIYRSEAAPEAATVSIGRNGYQVGGAVFFWKGSSYVQVLPSGVDEADAHAALEIAHRLAERIEDTGEPFWASTLLPKNGCVADSLQYLPTDAFSLDFLDQVFTAEYDLEGGRITLFIHRADDDTQAQALLDQYVAFFEKYGKLIWRSADASSQMVAGDVSGMIDVVFNKGRYLGGVAGAQNAEVAKRAAAAFHEELSVP